MSGREVLKFTEIVYVKFFSLRHLLIGFKHKENP